MFTALIPVKAFGSAKQRLSCRAIKDAVSDIDIHALSLFGMRLSMR